ncbi:hypothetical protein QQF64_008775 [Cirrhinus molitorella]|uniref:Uncharacterized protein n=1 Tax=Cirrhinus molitorella TaxID=172907 RepID=A0ABR3M730_9TELE
MRALAQAEMNLMKALKHTQPLFRRLERLRFLAHHWTVVIIRGHPCLAFCRQTAEALKSLKTVCEHNGYSDIFCHANVTLYPCVSLPTSCPLGSEVRQRVHLPIKSISASFLWTQALYFKSFDCCSEAIFSRRGEKKKYELIDFVQLCLHSLVSFVHVCNVYGDVTIKVMRFVLILMLRVPGGRGHANDVNGMGEVTSPFCAPPRVGDGRGREPGRADPTCDARIPGSVIFS